MTNCRRIKHNELGLGCEWSYLSTFSSAMLGRWPCRKQGQECSSSPDLQLLLVHHIPHVCYHIWLEAVGSSVLPDVALADAPPPPPRVINAPRGCSGPFRQRAPAPTLSSAVEPRHVPLALPGLSRLRTGPRRSQFDYLLFTLGVCRGDKPSRSVRVERCVRFSPARIGHLFQSMR